ncbi:MAG: transcriptional regulator, family [Frankiales bacterium]|nr:transcriptional regulator, family [Frankiales bacterium]
MARIELLGGFRVEAGPGAVVDARWPRRLAAAVLKLLALAPGHRLPRERLMDLLWPELDPAAAAANLRKAVYYARRALGPDGADILLSAGDLLMLAPAAVWIDVDAFRSAVARARRDGNASAYREAIELYREGLLPEDPYAQWAIEPREGLRAEFVQVLEEQAALLEARGELPDAIRTVRRLVAEDPWAEQPRAHLIRLHALAGRRADAIEEFRRLCSALAQLGAEPSPATRRLFEEVRARRDPAPQLTAGLWEEVGDLRLLAGDPTGAATAFERARRGSPSVGAQVRLHRKGAAAALMRQDPEAAEGHLVAAEWRATEPAVQARLACLRATQAWQRGDLDRARRLAERARDSATAHGDTEAAGAAEEALAIVAHLRGDWRQGLELEISRGTAEAAPSVLAQMSDIHFCIGQYHLYGDGLSADVEVYARRTLALARQAGATRAEGFAWCLLGEALLLRARWEEAAGCLQRSCELVESLGPNSVAALPWQRLGELAVCRGRPEDAELSLRRAAAIATVSPMARHLWGRIHATAALAALERGDPAAASSSVRDAAAAAARYGDCPTCSALLNPIAAEVFAALGDAVSAGAYADAASRVAASFRSAAWRAMAEAAAGSAAAAGGALGAADTHFQAAADLYARAGQPYWAQRARAQAAAAHAQNNREVLHTS